MSRRPIGRLLAICAPAALLAACAVTRIDVDVYKGPLANHEHVQTQQLAAMTIGAKPLLIQLRDQLAWPDRRTRECVRMYSWRPEQEELKQKQPGYPQMPRTTPPEKHPLPDWCEKDDLAVRSVVYAEGAIARFRATSEQAIRVNAVLSLYADQELHPVLSSYLRLVRSSLDRYDLAIAEFRSDPDKDAAAWSAILQAAGFDEDRLKPYLVERSIEPTGECIFHPVKSEADRRLVLLAEYKRFFHPGEESKNGMRIAKNRDAQCLPGAAAVVAPGLKAAGVAQYDNSTNVAMFALNQRDTVREHARVIFGPSDNSGREAQFIARALSLSGAFLSARGALTDAWEATQRLLYDIHTLPEFRAADFTAKRTRLADGLSRLGALLTQPRELAVSMAIEGWPAATSLAPPADGGWQVFGQDNVRWGPTRYDLATFSIQTGLSRDSAAVAQALLFLHEKWKKVDQARIFKAVEDEYDGKPGDTRYAMERRDKASRAFGIVRGPEVAAEAGAMSQSLRAAVEHAFADVSQAAPALGFEQGRLSQGIETLARRYIEAEAQTRACGRAAPCNRQAVEEARRILADALVQFAEKTLIIANNETLFALEDGGVSDAERSQRKQYILVLQGIGNAILVQADELQHRADHAARIDRRATAERQAVALARSRSGHQVIEDILADLGARERNAAAASSDLAAKFEQAKRNAGAAGVALAASDPICSTTDVTAAPEARQLVQAHRTLSGSAEAVDGVAVGDERIREDGGKLTAAVESVADLKTGAAIRAEILKWLRQQIVPGAGKQPRQRRLIDAVAYFDVVHPAIDASAGASTKAAMAAVKEAVAEAHETVAHSQQLLRQQADACKAVIAAQTAAAEARKSVDRYGGAAVAVRVHRMTALTKADAAGVAHDGAAVFGFLRQAVKEALDAAASSGDPKQPPSDEVLRLRAAHAALPEIGVPSASLAETGMPREGGTQKDALDDMIALLRYELIEAEKTGGSAGRASMIRQALETAYEHRAGLAYIRPAGAYLRTSYAATGLQNDPLLRWENMLAAHADRSIPPFGPYLANAHRSEDELRVIAEIDKQFWQSINSVRVAGGGNTNYVMVQDDIGNWYVKGYDADPEPIIKAAQRLALFNFGGQVNANLLRRLDLQRKVESGDANPAEIDELTALNERSAGGGDPSLRRIYERYSTAYVEAARADYADIRAISGKPLREELEQAWNARVDENDSLNATEKGSLKAKLKLHLDGAEKEMLTSSGERAALPEWTLPANDGASPEAREKEALERGKLILRALKGMKRFNQSAIGGLPKEADAVKEALVAAAAAAVEPKLRNFAERRLDAASDFERATKFVGEASTSANPPRALPTPPAGAPPPAGGAS